MNNCNNLFNNCKISKKFCYPLKKKKKCHSFIKKSKSQKNLRKSKIYNNSRLSQIKKIKYYNQKKNQPKKMYINYVKLN